MAERARHREPSADVAIGKRRANPCDGTRLEGGSVESAAPYVDGSVGRRERHRRDVQARDVRCRRLCFDDREIAARNDRDDPCWEARSVIESDGEVAEGGNVLGRDNADGGAVDSDDRAGTDAIALCA